MEGQQRHQQDREARSRALMAGRIAVSAAPRKMFLPRVNRVSTMSRDKPWSRSVEGGHKEGCCEEPAGPTCELRHHETAAGLSMKKHAAQVETRTAC